MTFAVVQDLNKKGGNMYANGKWLAAAIIFQTIAY